MIGASFNIRLVAKIFKMCGNPKVFGILVALCLSFVYFNPVECGDDWDGMLCFAGQQASAKFCKSCVTVYSNCKFRVICYFFCQQFKSLFVLNSFSIYERFSTKT